MMPSPRLNTAPVTNNQPPQTTTAARMRSWRLRTPASTSPTTANSSAAGISHDACPPHESLNMRVHPVGPHAPAWPAPPPPTTLPVSLPVSRPKPL